MLDISKDKCLQHFMTRRKGSENMAIQIQHFQLMGRPIALPSARSGYNLERLHFQLTVIALPMPRYGYNLERFILTHVPLTTPSF